MHSPVAVDPRQTLPTGWVAGSSRPTVSTHYFVLPYSPLSSADTPRDEIDRHPRGSIEIQVLREIIK